jgi:hypothetical protein
MADIIQIRRGTASQWASTNPILADGELGFETDTKKGKLGNGVTAWNSLPYSFTGESVNVAEQIEASPVKATPVDADDFGITDSASSNSLKKLSWANLKATLKTYFDTLYQVAGSYMTLGTEQTVTASKTFNQNITLAKAFINPTHDYGTVSSGFPPIQTILSGIRTMTLGGNISLSLQSGDAGAIIKLYLIQDATGSRTVSWVNGGASIIWAGGSAPTLSTTANSRDLVILTWLTGTLIFGEFVSGTTLVPSHNQNASTVQAGTFASGDFIFPNNLDINGQVSSPVNAKGNSGTGTVTFNWNDGNIQAVTLTGNCTFAFSNPKSGASYQIIITQDATGSRTITWPTIHWEGKAVPTLTGTANSKDILTITYDGTNYNAIIAKNFGTP